MFIGHLSALCLTHRHPFWQSMQSRDCLKSNVYATCLFTQSRGVGHKCNLPTRTIFILDHFLQMFIIYEKAYWVYVGILYRLPIEQYTRISCNVSKPTMCETVRVTRSTPFACTYFIQRY